MAKTRLLEKRARGPAKTKKAATRRLARTADPLLSAVKDATRSKVGGVLIEVGRAGAGRVKRTGWPT